MKLVRRPWVGALGAIAIAAMALVGIAAAQSPATSAAPATSSAPATSASAAPPCAPLPTLPPAGSPAASPAALAPITVFAAASLTNPFSTMSQAWATQHPGSTLTLSFGSSAALRTQIEQAAPADVFVSADTRNPQALIDACLAPAPITQFASNHLVIVVPKDDPAGITAATDLAKPGVRIVAAGDDVPITKYAEQVVANLAAAPGAAPGFADAYHANIVSREDDVAHVLAKIEIGEGDAALVYSSDAVTSDQVTAIALPEDVNVVASYGAVEVGSTTQAPTAQAFLAYLQDPEAQAILAQAGFLPPQ